MVARNDVACLGEASRCQEFFDRKMSELYNIGTVEFDNRKQTGARGQHRAYWVDWAPTSTICRNWPCIKIKHEELCELLDTKWARCDGNTLEDSVSKFPV
jgi:hypothetical protein